MSGDTSTHGNDAQAIKGWDTGAFWYPTLDRRGALLVLFVILLVLHFNEIFGMAASRNLMFGWWPINMVYYVGLNILHVGFMVLIYLNWPHPSDDDIDKPGVRAEDESPATSTAAEGD